ncbi:MAG: membrane protein insertase YidC [Deltaproteobacteria bacterium]|nr:membrane protein insertase YidC [Candidatus Anaeroferrophillacea bacterium]
MEKRTIIAVALSIIVLLGYQHLFMSPPPPAPPSVANTDSATAPAADAAIQTGAETVAAVVGKAAANAAVTPVPSAIASRRLTVDGPRFRGVIDTAGGVLQSFVLKDYRREAGGGSPPLDMVQVREPGYLPLAGTITVGSRTIIDRDLVYESEAPETTVLTAAGEAVTKLVLTAALVDGMRLEKEFTFKADSYRFDVRYILTDGAGRPVPAVDTVALSWCRQEPADAEKKRSYVYTGPLALVGDKIFEQSKKQKNIKTLELDGAVSWIGNTTKYFLGVLLPAADATGGIAAGTITHPRPDIEETILTLRGGTAFRVFIGPKEIETLRSVGADLERAVDFGWFGVIARPLVWMLNFFYRYVPNYGVAIIVLTLLIKLLFFPLSQKSYQSMSKMKQVQPKLQKIREKFKDDKARQQKEMMDLYRTHKVNPFGGCLPIVVQIPVFFALYRSLMVAIELRHAPFFGWITDLSDKDPYYVTPILMGLTMFLQQKMTPTTGDPTQAKMMLFMPVIFTFMFLNFPSGLVLYWLVNNVLSIGQQYMVMRQAQSA